MASLQMGHSMGSATKAPVNSPDLRARVWAFIEQAQMELREADKLAQRQRADGEGEWLTGLVDGNRALIEKLDNVLHNRSGYRPEPPED